MRLPFASTVFVLDGEWGEPSPELVIKEVVRDNLGFSDVVGQKLQDVLKMKTKENGVAVCDSSVGCVCAEVVGRVIYVIRLSELFQTFQNARREFVDLIALLPKTHLQNVRSALYHKQERYRKEWGVLNYIDAEVV